MILKERLATNIANFAIYYLSDKYSYHTSGDKQFLTCVENDESVALNLIDCFHRYWDENMYFLHDVLAVARSINKAMRKGKIVWSKRYLYHDPAILLAKWIETQI